MPERHSDRSRLIVLLATCFLTAAGCGDGRPSMDTSRNEAKVSGTVKVEGKVVGGGEILFNPSNAERQVGAFVGKVAADGTYSVTTFTGANIIKFRGELTKAHPELALTSRFAEVAAGESVIDFDLLGESDKPRGQTYGRSKGAKARGR